MVASATKLRLFMNAAGRAGQVEAERQESPDTGRRMESGTVTAGAAAEAWVVAVGAAPEALGTSAALGARALALGAGWIDRGGGGGADQVGEDGRGGALDRRSHGARFDRVQCAHRGCDL